MAKKVKWLDEYWLPLMQIYLLKPIGIKPVYHRKMVELGMDIHIHPSVLHAKMSQLAKLDTPRMERIWQTYGKDPQKLARAVSLWREMRGYGNADEFYDGVEVAETFEPDFKPVSADSALTPAMLIIILDLYFRLTPITMVAETPEIKDLAHLLQVKPQDIVEAMDVFQRCDPYLNRKDMFVSGLLLPCHNVWRRFGNGSLEELSAFAEQLMDYFRT